MNLDEYKAVIANKAQQLKVAELELMNLRGAADGDISRLQNDLKYAEEAYNKALTDYNGGEEVYASGGISKIDLDGKKETLDSKKKAVEDLRFFIAEEGNNIKMQQEKIRTLQNELETCRGKLGRAYIEEDNIVCELENGVVYDIGYKAGDIMDPAIKVLSVLDLDGVYINAKVAEEFIKDVKPGAEVIIHPLFDSARTYAGKVQKIADMAIVENGQTYVQVQISIENKDGALLPNFNVDVEIKR